MPKILDYTIIKQLGFGKFGIVYLVESSDKNPYAIKIIEVNEENKNHAKK